MQANCSVNSVKSVGASLRLRGRSLLLKRKLPRNSRNTQKFIAEKKLPQISQIYTDVSKMFCEFREFCGSKYLCESVQSVGEYSLPVCSVCSVKSVGASLMLRGRSLLLKRNSHGIHGIHRSLLLRRNSHRFHGFTQMQANCSVNSVNSVGVFTLYKYLCGSVQSVGEYSLPVCSVCSVKSVGASLMLRGRSLLLKRKLPQNSQNSQKFIVEKKLPQISRIYTDVSKMFCVFREFCGSKYLCKSVKSVGEYSLPVCSVNSVNSVGGFNPNRSLGFLCVVRQREIL